jgi:hypothetical protein
MTVREEAHRLLDEVPDDRLPRAVEVLRQWVEQARGGGPQRRFRTTAIFDGEPDLATRSKEIIREEWEPQERRAQ